MFQLSGADLPNRVTYRSVGCPAALVQKSGCGVADGGADPTGSDPTGADTVGAGAADNSTTSAGDAGADGIVAGGADGVETGAAGGNAGLTRPSTVRPNVQILKAEDPQTSTKPKCKRGKKKRMAKNAHTGNVLRSVADNGKMR